MLERPETLQATTYKIRSLDQAFYITISNIEIDGVVRPFEIFINTKSQTHHAYLTCITRLISAFFRSGNDYSFIVTELKEVHDGKEGNYWKKGICYPSLIAEIGGVLEDHLKSLNKIVDI